MKIRLEEITWSGVVKDGIPSLDNPQMIGAGEAEYLRDDDLVFGISINGDVRAYPLRVMGWHEMFNDVIGGVPMTEEALVAPDGRSIGRLAGQISYWFAWNGHVGAQSEFYDG